MWYRLSLCLFAVAMWAAPVGAQSPVPFPSDPAPPEGPPPTPTDPGPPGGPPTLPSDPGGPGGPPTLPSDPGGPDGAPSFPTDPSLPNGAPSFPNEPLPSGPGEPSFTLTGEEGWRTLALPYAELTLGGRGPGYLEPLSTAGYAGADVDQRNRRGRGNVFLYDEPTGSFAPPRNERSVSPGMGFWIYVWEDDDPRSRGVQGGFPKTLDVSGGVVVAGSYDFGLTYSPASPAPGLHLVGNPYDQAIDWDHPSWTRTGVSETVYVWDPERNPPDGAFRTWNGVVGDVHRGEIAAGQGFHVEATGPGAALIVREEAKVGRQGAVYGKTAAPPTGLAFRLSGRVAGQERESAVFVAPHAEASLGFDARDGRRLAGASGGGVLRLVALVPAGYDGEGHALAIAAVPRRLPGAVEIPLYAEALADGVPTDAEATLAWDAPSLPTGWTAMLQDRATGRSHALTNAGALDLSIRAPDALTYAPSAPAAGEKRSPSAVPPLPRAWPLHTERPGEARFALVLTPASRTHHKGGGLEIGEVGPNPARSSATLALSVAEAGIVTVAVYDALGRLVASAETSVGEGPHRLAVPMAGLAPGTYAVRVEAVGLSAARRLTVVR